MEEQRKRGSDQARQDVRGGQTGNRTGSEQQKSSKRADKTKEEYSKPPAAPAQKGDSRRLADTSDSEYYGNGA